ncbi:acyl carrier protein [Actinosynnema sp. CS-041913]|uniref:acyl carrier protein n=1 Tax=Actinosynnema sp. CS-041913 TaxID=3239917 RepID=UPI003D90E294
MGDFSLQELKEIMRTASGVPEDVDLDGDIADVEFQALGYDSLAVLELVSQVERRYRVSIPEDAIPEMPTPARAVRFINGQLARLEA